MILNSPYISGSLTVTGNTNLMGALTVTGSLAGTATSSSFAYTASSAVSAYTAASAVNATTALTASYATSFTVGGTLTAQTLVVQTITSSVSFITGSTRFGSSSINTHDFTGSVNITGSLTVNTTGTEFQVTNAGVVMGNLLADNHNVTGSLRVNTNGLFVSSSGFVGLNKAVPQRQYTQVANANGIVFTIQNAASSNEGFIAGFDIPGSTYIQLSNSANSSTVYLNSSGSSYFTGGNVGIGTTTPTNRLETIGISGSSGIITPLYVRGWNATTNTGGTETSYGGIHLSNNLDTTVVLRVLGSGHAQLSTDSSGRFLSFGTDAFVERMRIASGGSVGIGCTPGSITSVDIQNLSATSNNVFLRLQNNTASEDCGIIISGSFGTAVEHRMGINTIVSSKDLTFHNSNTAGYRWYTDGVNTLNITSGGAVTTPLQPFAMGGLDGNQSISLNTFTTLNFSTSVGMFYYANVGNCWNNSTRAFTAPVTGTYLVNVSLMTDAVGQVALHVNGVRKHSIPSYPFTSSSTWGGSAMIPLSSGEALTLQGYGNAGTVTQNTFHTFFAIYLLG